MKFSNATGAVFAAIALSVAAFGQTTTTTPPATCKTAPAGLTALNLERVVPIADILTTLTPTTPANVLAAIAGGALEIHELMVYNPQLGTETSTVFALPAGAPIPTPLSNITPANTAQFATMKISQIITSCTPLPSLALIGTIIDSSPAAAAVYGMSANGSTVAISIGYTTDNPPKINNVAEVVAGQVVLYSASATGTLTFPAPSSTGTTTPGTGPNVVVKFANGTVAVPNTTTQTNVSPFFLDASGSTGSGALTFAWTTTSNSPVAFVGTGAPGQILVQLPGPGDYAIKLTVTDSSGASATFSLTLEYTGRPQ